MLTALACTLSSAQDQLNRLNVAVTDHKGQAVTGLQASDFRIQEDGKARNIVFLRFSGDQPGPAKQAVAGEYSNRAGAAPHATVILLDLLNEQQMIGGSVISDQLTRAFKNIESCEDLYLYFLTTKGELYPVRPLPKPGAPLQPAAEPWSRNLTPMLDAALKTVTSFQSPDNYEIKTRVEMTTHALREIGTEMQVMPGRKNLVWMTRGIPLNGHSITEGGMVDFSTNIRVLCELLQRVEIAVYPVGAPLDSESDLALVEIAGLTGGRKYAFGGIGDAVRDAVADSRANYQIAFGSTSERMDSKHRKVRVTCTRKDVRLQTISGFYDLVAMPQRAVVEHALVENTARSPLDANDIGVRASVAPDPALPHQTRIDVRIDPADLLLTEAQGYRTGKILVVFTTYGPGGLLEPRPSLRPDIKLTPEQYAAAARDGIEYHPSMALSADVRKVRVIVVDDELAAIGSVTIPIQR